MVSELDPLQGKYESIIDEPHQRGKDGFRLALCGRSKRRPQIFGTLLFQR